MKKTPFVTALSALVISSALLMVHHHSSAAPVPGDPDQTAPGTSSMERQIVAKEREGLEALKSADLKTFGDLTADDAVFVDAAGPAGKAQVLKNVEGFKLVDYTMKDVRFVAISSKSGLISYTINEKGASHGHEFAADVYVSSVWVKRQSQWLCVFSQETAARKVHQ
jgi:ketosteroid isomerase-like protein